MSIVVISILMFVYFMIHMLTDRRRPCVMKATSSGRGANASSRLAEFVHQRAQNNPQAKSHMKRCA